MTGWLKNIWRAPYPAYIASWKTVTVPAAIVFFILSPFEKCSFTLRSDTALVVHLR